MKLIVGLGNPGKEYQDTRHNVGFMCLNKVVEKLGLEHHKEKFQGQYYKGKLDGEDFILLFPLTFMNLSGKAVAKFVKYFKIKQEDILIIYDDIDLPVGKVRIRTKGSSGGQKGMTDIINFLGTQDISRIRVGISRDPKIPVINYVLQPFSKNQSEITEAINIASEAAIYFINNPIDKVATKFN